MSEFKKTKNELPKVQKNVTLYGVNCSYDMLLNAVKKHFLNYEINCNADFITININGTIVSINTNKSSDENYYKEQASGMCQFFSNTFMNLDTNLEKSILKQILAFNSIFGIAFSEAEGSNEIESIVVNTAFNLAKEFNLYLFFPSMELYNKEGKLVISIENNECDVTELKPILPEKFDTTGAERIIRKAISNAKIKKQEIACFEGLPCIEASNEVHLKSLDEICKRAIASFLIIQLACDIHNGQYEKSVEIVSKLLEKFKVSDCLNKKEKKLLDGTYEMQDAIDIDWEYEAYWSLIWALGLVDDISDGSDICDCNYAIELFNESNSYEDFKSKCKLRDVNEILDMLDLYYRYYWACVEKGVKPETSIGDLNPSVVVERRRGLEWIISKTQDWYDISLDT